MLDSLVRVSRRVNENHFVSIANTHVIPPKAVPGSPDRRALLSKPVNPAGLRGPSLMARVVKFLSPAQRMTGGVRNAQGEPTSPPAFSAEPNSC
jgi:hypothetical protein